MQIARNATLLAALAVTSVSILVDTAAAVEVSDSTTPLLSTAQRATPPDREPLPNVTPPSPDCFILGSRSFTIPFTVDAGGTQPIEVRQYRFCMFDDFFKRVSSMPQTESSSMQQ